MLKQLAETVAFIKDRTTPTASTGIILGSGLGNFASEINIQIEIPYDDIPHFPISTVEGHYGKLIFGTLGEKNIIAMAGRFHYYEGYSAHEVGFPIRVMKALGMKTLLISNAAGGVNTDFKVGDLMIIKDHISMAVVNPLIGLNEISHGPRFPDMSEPYNKSLIAKARLIAADLGIELREGVYFGVTGPTFETRAEYKMIHQLGGDVVGMSTVQEVITAVHAGVPVFAISVITDIGIRDEDNQITHKEVLEAARDAEPKVTAIFKRMIADL